MPKWRLMGLLVALVLAAVASTVWAQGEPPLVLSGPMSHVWVDSDGKEWLRIDPDGKVTYQGMPDEAALAMIKSLKGHLTHQRECQQRLYDVLARMRLMYQRRDGLMAEWCDALCMAKRRVQEIEAQLVLEGEVEAVLQECQPR